MVISGKVQLKHQPVHINFRIKSFQFWSVCFNF